MSNLDFYYPFDSVSGDRKITAATERRFWSELFGDGVVSADGFKLNTTATAGTFGIAAGTAIVGGCIGGTTAKYQITANPAAGTSGYIVIRTDTNNAVRKMTLEFVKSLQSATQEQLAAGGQRDLPLYKVTANAAGKSYTVNDLRKWANSFDKSEFSAQFDAMVASVKANAETAFDAQSARFEAAITAADAENSGTYGAAGRQGFINPRFAVNQRGSESYDVQTAYTFDRWMHKTTAAASATVTRVSEGMRRALKVTNASLAGTGRNSISQAIERGVSTFAAGGQSFTVSFDARADSVLRLFVEPVQYAKAGGSAVAIAAQEVELSTRWQRFALTFEGTITPAADAADVLKVAFHYAWRNQSQLGTDQSAAGTVYLANMQINKGTAALACSERDYAEELERCRRYFVKLGATSLCVGATLATTNQAISSPLPLSRPLYRKPTVTAKDRANVVGAASCESAAGGWRNGLPFVISSDSEENPVFVVTNTDATLLTRVVFNAVELDAEIYD